MAVIHIEKANPEINGLYQFINQQFLIEEFPEAEWVNREDDMGLEGLRKAENDVLSGRLCTQISGRTAVKRQQGLSLGGADRQYDGGKCADVSGRGG